LQQIFHHIGENEIGFIVKAVLSIKPLPRIILLVGNLGAGKTTLVKALVKSIGSNAITQSPTFSLINEYPLIKGGKIIHSDWYRIKNANELYDAGIVEYIDSDNTLIIEWPEIGMDLLESEYYLKITIEHQSNTRTYTLEWFNA
jgi:tRNA threonylcarbamoyladenosine biosynthesis protein TsaE